MHHNYPSNTPEQKMVEFLFYWQKNNYGFMATCYAPMLQMQPVDAKERFRDKSILDWKLVEIQDFTSAVADIKVNIKMATGDEVVDSILEFRLVCSSPNGDLAYIQTEDTLWGITIWRKAA